jgi:hypothetical protein
MRPTDALFIQINAVADRRLHSVQPVFKRGMFAKGQPPKPVLFLIFTIFRNGRHSQPFAHASLG